jgi:hypothetical protein
VKQLAISTVDKNLHHALVNKYREKKLSGFLSAHLSNEESEHLLLLMAAAYKRTTFIIDALDECERSSRIELIDALNRLVKEVSGLKVLISSRRDDDLRRKLQDGAKLEIDATKNQDDIQTFVLTKLNERHKPFSTELQNDIINTLHEKSHGM